MNSSTKNSISEKIINQLVENAVENKALGSIENKNVISYKEMKNGYFNTIYSLQLLDSEIILKIAPSNDTHVLRYEKNIMRAEVLALNLVTENTDLPVPKVYFYDDTKCLVDFEYFFMQKMSGEDLNSIHNQLEKNEKAKIEIEIGRMNRKINEISGSKFGYLSQTEKQTCSWREAFSDIVLDIILDGKEREVSLPYEEIENVFKSFIFACDDIKEPKLVHWDLWAGNVLIKNNKISGIIDFERALWADPLMEYYFSNILDNNNFSLGYEINLNELNKNAKIRRGLYNLYLYLVLVIECYYRNYEDSSQNAQAKKSILNEIRNFEKF